MTTTPTTSGEAATMIASLQAKRASLVQTIDSAAERRKGLATAAEFGDAAAKKALAGIETEVTSARGALENLDLVIGEMTQLKHDLHTREADESARIQAEQLSAAIDELLAIDDTIDAALQQVRELLEKRREIARAPILRNAKTKFAGTLVIREREIASSLLAYFDRELSHLRGNESFAAISRVADWDAKHFGKKSPGMLARGPRELSPFERTMKANVERSGWAGKAGSGHDSQLEAAKFHEKGGRQAAQEVSDVSRGWPA